MKDLIGFIETNLMNRIKAFAMIWEGMQNRDLKKVNNGLFQMSPGVEDVIGKTAQLGKEMAAVAKAGENIERQQQRLEKDRINNIATNKTLLGLIEAQKNIRDNEFNSIDKRKKAKEEAAKLEQRRLKTLEDLAQRQVDILMQEANLCGGIDKLRNDEVQKIKEAENEQADIREDSLGRQNETITNRYQLE
ncbi:hypothetical protein [Rufibacter hautae]|uniref:Uncharacterized protein n=1 Tax=Rufibacter hautae TaxID=2595005 RepID=A0A5B6TDD1_9BACT|nr:hypothetical protein [Rufibacter hautae]KAA3438467.1 hypothetical protein FOA19_14625 [Rufibacter hautae]